MLCRARWARPDSWSCDHSGSFPNAGISPLRRRTVGMKTDEVCGRPLETFGLPCGLIFLVAGISRLRARQGGFPIAPLTPSVRTPMFLELLCCRGNRLCGGDQRALRSPSGLLRTALPCFLNFIAAEGKTSCHAACFSRCRTDLIRLRCAQPPSPKGKAGKADAPPKTK